jgi:mannitol-1-phosphate 5-dehydrogenase
MTSNPPSALILGAGSVGRGFIGQLFSESGYEVVLADVDETLVAALNRRGAYTLRLAGIGSTEERTISPVRALDARQADLVAGEVARAGIAATAVGARALASLGPAIAAGLMQRQARGPAAPLNFILCENLHGAPDLLREAVRAALPPDERPRLGSIAGFVHAVIARMSPVPTPEQRAADPSLIVAEPYGILPTDRAAFVGAVPHIEGMQAVAPFEAYVARKLFIHNTAHATLGYLGHLRGHAYGWQALEDPWVRDRLALATRESAQALIAAYGFEPVSFAEHIDGLLMRFSNRALGDPVTRLARDPIRKLAPDDRLVGAARLAEKHGIPPGALALGIAAALAYDEPSDPHAVELQARMARDGLDATMESICAIRPGEALAAAVRSALADLRPA